MYRAVFLTLLACGLAQAHVVSMSSGELRVTGPRSATYELRMPAYEIESVSDPATALFDEVSIAGAQRTSSECAREDDHDLCTAQYEFAEDIGDAVDVRCTLFRITVPNHVHMLYAVKGEEGDQQVFDQSSTEREMRFHPPSALEQLTKDAGGGVLRLLGSVGGLLFLGALVLAARSGSEAAVLAAAFVAAEWVARPVAGLLPIGLSPEFLEAAMALTVAYLAAEILFLPDGRARWAIVPLLGLVHGLPYAAFPAAYLGGAVAVQVVLIGALAVAALRMPRAWMRPAAAVLLVAGVAWFGRLLLG